MEKELICRITGMTPEELSEKMEADMLSLHSSDQLIMPKGFSTPEDREARREELRNRPVPRALKPPNTGELTPFERDMDIFPWWR